MSALFGRDFVLLVVLSVMGLLVFLVHFGLIRRVWGSTRDPRERVLLVLPPATPFVAWRAGHPIAAVVWVLIVGTYVVLRFQG